MSEANKEVARGFFEEGWGQRNSDAVDKYMADDFSSDRPLPGVTPDADGLKQWMAASIRAFPDQHWEIEDIMAEGDRVAIRWSVTGTHQAEFMGIPATGKQVTVRGMTLDQIEDGKIKKSWGEWDTLGMLQQLGVIPETGGA